MIQLNFNKTDDQPIMAGRLVAFTMAQTRAFLVCSVISISKASGIVNSSNALDSD
jgi:hypothetical protein